MARRSVDVERVIKAPPEAIFELLADPAMHPVLDGSGTVRHPREGNPGRLSLGATFGMSMRFGLPYRITNTVVEFDEGRRIAWRHFGGHRWRYELTPVPCGEGQDTKVTETFDYSTARSPLALELLRYPQRNRKGMEQTLERLAARFEPSAGSA